jgi:hypothetical protein
MQQPHLSVEQRQLALRLKARGWTADSSDRCNTRVVRELRWQVAEGRVGRHTAIIESGLRG